MTGPLVLWMAVRWALATAGDLDDCASGRLASCVAAATAETDLERRTSVLRWACDLGEPEACRTLAGELSRLAAELPHGAAPCRGQKGGTATGSGAGGGSPVCVPDFRPDAEIGRLLQQACEQGSNAGCLEAYRAHRQALGRATPARGLPPADDDGHFDVIGVEASQWVASARRLPEVDTRELGRKAAIHLAASETTLWHLSRSGLLAYSLATGKRLGALQPLQAPHDELQTRLELLLLGTDAAGAPVVLLRRSHPRSPEELALWKPLAGTYQRLDLPRDTPTLCSAALSLEGKLLALVSGPPTASDGRLGCDAPGTAHALLYDVSTAARIAQLGIPFRPTTLGLDSSGAALAGASRGEVWLRRPNGSFQRWKLPGLGNPRSLSVGRSGKAVAIQDGAAAFLVRPGLARPLRLSATSSLLLPEGNHLVVSTGRTIRFVQAATGADAEPALPFASSATQLLVGQDGRTLLARFADKGVGLLSLRAPAAPAPQREPLSPEALAAMRPLPALAPPPAAVTATSTPLPRTSASARPGATLTFVAKSTERGEVRLFDGAGSSLYGATETEPSGGQRTVFEGLKPGAFTLLFFPEAKERGSAAPRHRSLSLGEGQQQQLAPSDTSPGVVLRGRVLDGPRRMPRANLTIETHFVPPGGPTPSSASPVRRAFDVLTRTGPKGEFELAGLLPGRQWVRVSGGLFEPSETMVELRAGMAPVELLVQPSGLSWKGLAPNAEPPFWPLAGAR